MRATEESGSMLIEAVVGPLVLVVAITGVIASMRAGMTLVGGSRQRDADERKDPKRDCPVGRG